MVQSMDEMELCSLLVTRVQPLESTVSNATNSTRGWTPFCVTNADKLMPTQNGAVLLLLLLKLYTANEVLAGRQVCEKYLANGKDVF